MSASIPNPLPAPPPGTRDATLRDHARSLGWVALAIGSRVFTRRTTLGQWLTSALIVAATAGILLAVTRAVAEGTVVSLAFLAAVAGILIFTAAWMARRRRRRSVRHYVLEDGMAILSVTAYDGTWHLAGHGRAIRAKGAGERLQNLLIPSLVAVADDANVAIAATAAAAQLARGYQARLPGLLDVGPAWPYGRRLYRPRVSDRKTLCGDVHRRVEPANA